MRIDKSFDVLNEKSKIAIKLQQSTLKQKIDDGVFVPNENQYRVLVLGDSYFFGAGINPEFKVSNNLKKLLQEKLKTNKEILILDASRPSNNTLDNYNLFKYYQQKFKPNTIVLGYNFNDILGDLNIKKTEYYNVDKKTKTASKVASKNNLITEKKDNYLKSFSKKLYNTSELLRFLSKKTQKELKLNGVVIPFGEFYFLTQKAYNSKNNSWKQTKEIISKLNNECIQNNINFIFYKLPEFNLLNNNSLFTKVDSSLETYLKSKPTIKYINGFTDFKNEGNFLISKYDGHPNELAHKIISERIVKEIIDNKLFLTFDK
ncbi:MAG: hypothetical protein AB8B78_12645 [Polaribacter sp.]